MSAVAEVIQRECLEQGLAQGKCSQAIAVPVQDVCKDFLLCQLGPGPLPHGLQRLQTWREQSEGPGATQLPWLPSLVPT